MPPIFDYNFTIISWILLGVCGILIGISKTGIAGAGTVVVPIMAAVFGGKPSTGVLLPMLIMTDVFAVAYYHRFAEWKYILKLLPASCMGIILALIIGNYISPAFFTKLIAIAVFTGIGLMIWKDFFAKKVIVPSHPLYAYLLGFAGGFFSMIGNAAGPLMSLYFLSMKLPKNSFIGTGAWFFFIINLIKLPLHIFFWQTISLNSFYFNLKTLPFIIIGIISGILIVKRIPEKPYKIVVIISVILSSIVMMTRN
jgi:uncharacterized protein